ncbi:MAG: monovalent cation:proton antiporter-2 (CPA2) family protein [Burkholderiales bacterium]
MSSALFSIVVLLLAVVITVMVFRRFRLPPILGYLLVGMSIGPFAFGWLPDDATTNHLAEFGIVFLMFSIGLEFSLAQLSAMRRTVFGLGGAQVTLTIVAVMAIALAIGFDWREGLTLGGILAMTSTAIVAKLLMERVALQSIHGRLVMGVLLFQDLAVVPLLVLLPALAQGPERFVAAFGIAFLKAALILSILLWYGRGLMRRFFHLVARQKSSEIFVLNVLLITLGLAWVTELAGLSMALGAFVAGILISETEYRYQVEDYIKPFRDVLLGLFFVTIGMKLDPRTLIDHLPWVLLTVMAIVIIKFAIVWSLVRAFRHTASVATRCGLILSNAGEFGFVLMAQAGLLGLLGEGELQIVLAAMLISMLIAPLAIGQMDRIVLYFCESEWTERALHLHELAIKAMGRDRHVIICGYGRSGQTLARFLAREDIAFIALDADPDRVRQAAAAGDSVVFGDAGRRDVLLAAGASRAAAMVVSFSDVAISLRILEHAREVNPGLPIIVRTTDDSELEKLQNAGATEVVPEILEGSLMLASHAMLLLGIPLARVLARIREVRRDRYHLMRGFFHGVSDLGMDVEDSDQPRLKSVMLSDGAAAVGKSLDDLNLEELEVEINTIYRQRTRIVSPKPESVLETGDVVVLLGRPDALGLAEDRLIRFAD